jgi:hypothetical protein
MTQAIIYPQDNGNIALVMPSGEIPIEQVAQKDVPAGKPYLIVDADAIPTDRTFRGAWVMGDCCIEHDLDRCRAIGHQHRRAARAEEFAPLDALIAKQIPGVDAAEAEAARQAIRERYADVQTAIDAATTPEEIKTALGCAD